MTMQCCCGDVHRNERDTALAKVAHKLTKDPDLFLGEKVIEVRRVGAPRDVWYKLGKRADMYMMCLECIYLCNSSST